VPSLAVYLRIGFLLFVVPTVGEVIVTVGRTVSSVIDAEYADDQFPAMSWNMTATVLAPSPGLSVQAFVVAYVSGALHDVPSLLNFMKASPLTASNADSVNVTDALFVAAAPLLIES
jgi:hypothetical protein